MVEKSIYYRGLLLDRASEFRKSEDWIDEQWRHPDCQVLLLQNNLNLMRWNRQPTTAPVAIFHQRVEIESLLRSNETIVFLGLNDQAPLFSAELVDHSTAPQQSQKTPHEFIDLREVGSLLNAQDAAVLAYARGLAYWNRHSRYCGRCGSSTIKQQGGHAKLCSNPDCRYLTFPRTDPAVIMLVEDSSTSGPARCLLGRNARFPNRMMSTLAGYVDPSESLEETVAREVFEEAGVRVDQIEYQASQPWPFPASIMLGFRAQALTTEICVDGVEIEEAHWFSAEQLQGFGEWGDDSEGYCLPRGDSIARYLIESWIADQL
ncbi:MAG: NAD+ diphosphatase [Gammaproteobacteria bacterium]|jgi:NAD+ diphosphatase